MTPPTLCLECGAKLSPAETQGLCAPCLLKFGLASQLGGSSVAGSPGSSGPPPMMPFNFGTYKIVRLLGKGGMGAVYEAEDRASGRRVALKALGHSLDSPETRKRFLREGRIAASINHPNTVYVFGTEEIDGAPVITMEMVHGGTLHERVKESGPMAITEAVDAILQIIAGLEAAAAVGILHRDIKPANCFIEASGAVKVGDFGLSISTTTRGDSALTIAGSVLGTPEFSSPEQLRGEELNVRSDIYSVGMTLYYLLTGKTPFHAENMVQLLATVLDKPAPSPRTVRPEIPEPLARIVLRCLAKQAGERFANYDELRRALVPFNSTAPTPATLGLRFVAGVIDRMVLVAVAFAAPAIIYRDLGAMVNAGQEMSVRWSWFSVGVLLWRVLYFAVPEGLWGASLGKALVGLRVAALNRCAPGLARAFIRAGICVVPVVIGLVPMPGGLSHAQQTRWSMSLGAAVCTAWALLFITARRRNGFAAIQDLASKTRVIAKTAYQARPSIAQADEPIASVEELPRLGPYHVIGPLASGEDGELLLGYDTKLLRRVWIRKASADEPNVPAPVRNAGRSGRLRWLLGQRMEGDSWDAYEAVPGTPLVNLLDAPQPWKAVRYWLLDLAEELDAASRDGSLPAALAPDRVWIDAGGRAKLLDFPAPGAGPDGAGQPDEPALFLNQLAISALEGRRASIEEARQRAAAVPAPIPAREFLRTLAAGGEVAELPEKLRPLVRTVPRVSRRRRLGLFAACVSPVILTIAFMLLVLLMALQLRQEAPDLEPMFTLLEAHQRLEKKGKSRSLDPAKAPHAIEIYFAGRYGDVVRDSPQWSSTYASLFIKPDMRERAERIVKANPDPSPAEMAAATKHLRPLLDKRGEVKAGSGFEDLGVMRKAAQVVIAVFLGLGAVLSLICAAAFRSGPLMRLLGIAIVREDGSDASRLRTLGRAFIAWSPVIFGFGGGAVLAPPVGSTFMIWSAYGVACALAVWSLLLPERSLQDRLARTWLVPR